MVMLLQFCDLIDGVASGYTVSQQARPSLSPLWWAPTRSSDTQGLARLLRRQGDTSGDFNQQQVTELFRRMVFNILIDNTDDHEKNHSLLVQEPSDRPRFELAPAYDILPTNSGQGYQEFICGAFGRDSTLDNAMSECESFGLSPKNAAQEVVKVIDVVNTWQTHFGEIGVSAKDIQILEQTIDSESLRSQRIKFDPNRFEAITKKKKQKNPLA